MLESTPAHAYALLCIRETGKVRQPNAGQPVWPVAIEEHSAIVVCPKLDAKAVEVLTNLQVSRLVAYTDRPDSLQDAFEGKSIAVTAYPLSDALRWGQVARTRDIPAASESAETEATQ